jgi:alkanesulfonate monooxygenase SsuD/methylene tetrahydromethanopterin reductase-like flavin-dependent oxidoreductase (luciferase family)
MTSSPLAPGSISLRMYPHALPADEIVAGMRTQAQAAERAGFDGVMTSEHHGGFPGYLPNPLPAAGWLLDATQRLWAAPAPLLLPLRHWTHVAEDVAWMASRHPGRVGVGFACGGLAQDFDLAELPYEENLARFKVSLPSVVDALRGSALPPLAGDSAVAACATNPVPMTSAAQSPGAARRAAKLGIGILYDSLQTVLRTRALSDAYRDAGGTGTRIAIRRVWLGAPPTAEAQRQVDFYRSYATRETQQHWGEGQELITGATGTELAERLAAFVDRGGCDALNLRLHQGGLEPAQILDQIAAIGSEVLPALRAAWGVAA